MAYNDPLTTFDAVSGWMKSVGPVDEPTVLPLIPSASELIARFCDRDNLGGVYSYTEVRTVNPRRITSFGVNRNFRLILKRYPVVSITSVAINGAPINVLSASDLGASPVGVYLDTNDAEPRMLDFYGLAVFPPALVQVVYTAGYSVVPDALQQACNTLVADMLRQPGRVGVKSLSMGGETTSYDQGSSWGMSNRVKAMCQPFKNLVPAWEP